MESEVEYCTHDDSEPTNIETLHNFENCESCQCAIVEKRGRHCQHCYHCQSCSSAVAVGCRPCPSIFDKSIYSSYVGMQPKGGNSNRSQKLRGVTEPDANDKLGNDDRQEFEGPRSESYAPPELRDGVYYHADGSEVDAEWLDNAPSPCSDHNPDFNNNYPPIPDQAARDAQAKEAIEKLWGGDIRNMPGYHASHK